MYDSDGDSGASSDDAMGRLQSRQLKGRRRNQRWEDSESESESDEQPPKKKRKEEARAAPPRGIVVDEDDAEIGSACLPHDTLRTARPPPPPVPMLSTSPPTAPQTARPAKPTRGVGVSFSVPAQQAAAGDDDDDDDDLLGELLGTPQPPAAGTMPPPPPPLPKPAASSSGLRSCLKPPPPAGCDGAPRGLFGSGLGGGLALPGDDGVLGGASADDSAVAFAARFKPSSGAAATAAPAGDVFDVFGDDDEDVPPPLPKPAAAAPAADAFDVFGSDDEDVPSAPPPAAAPQQPPAKPSWMAQSESFAGRFAGTLGDDAFGGLGGDGFGGLGGDGFAGLGGVASATSDAPPPAAARKPQPKPVALGRKAPKKRAGEPLPAKAEALKQQGNASVAKKAFAQAAKEYTDALAEIAVDGDTPDDVYFEGRAVLLSNRSHAHCSQRLYKKAFADAVGSVLAHPGWHKGYMRKAAVLQAINEADAALAALDLALRHAEPGTPAYQSVATMQRQVDAEKGKARPVDAAARRFYDVFLSESKEGTAAFKRKDYPGALSHYSKALAEDGCSPVLLCNRAAAAVNFTRYADALRDAETALALNPQHLKAYVRKAEALKGSGRLAEALDVVDEAEDVLRCTAAEFAPLAAVREELHAAQRKRDAALRSLVQ